MSEAHEHFLQQMQQHRADEAKVREVAQGLRELADTIERVPELAEALSYNNLTINHPCDTAEEIRELRRKMGGLWRKRIVGEYFNLSRQFGPAVAYDLYVARERVCERRVVGTTEVEVEEPLPEAIAALPRVKQTRVEETVEWVCPDILGGS